MTMKHKATRLDLSEWLKLRVGTKEDQLKLEFPSYWRVVMAKKKRDIKLKQMSNWMEIENEM